VDRSIVSHVHLRLLCRCAQNYGAGEKSNESAKASPRQNSQAEHKVRQSSER
jgi:hypothetical protein